MLVTSIAFAANAITSLGAVNISVVAPASGVDAKVLANLRKLPRVALKVPECCFTNSSKTPFHSNSDELRYQCLVDAINDPSTDVIWSLRGGYGSAKLIAKLKTLPKPAKEKIFIGYSDITALHLFFSQEWGWHTVHGAGIAEIFDDTKARSNFSGLEQIISGKKSAIAIKDLVPMNKYAKTTVTIKGSLTGGNLSMVQTSLGTSWRIESDGKILFLEDLGMHPYQIDRALHHLKQAGVFDKVHGVIFGSFSPINKGMESQTLKTLESFARSLKIPVFKSNRFGHQKVNDPIRYNVIYTINPINKGELFELSVNQT